MNTIKFKTQREAAEYYGRSWSYILRHYNVTVCHTSGERHYFISKN